MSNQKFITLLNIPVYTKTLIEFADEVTQTITDGSKGKVLFCANPNAIVVAQRDSTFLTSMQEADWVQPDGIGVVLAMRLFGQKNIQRITGYDMMLQILHKLNGQPKGCVFFLGSTEKTLSRISQRIKKDYPVLKFGAYSPPFKRIFTAEDNAKLIKIVNQFKPDVLFVGMTAPKQEKWIYQNRNKLDVPVLSAVGAAFDFYAGTKRRAPIKIQRMGLEWLWRLVYEPKRLWRRSLVSAPIFTYRILKQFILKR